MILVELTEGDKSNFSVQVERKEAHHHRELTPGLLGSVWKARLITVEMGCRGFWYQSLAALLNYLCGKESEKAVSQEVALIALKCF